MATIFSNTLQQAAAKIAKASLSTRLQLATDFYNTVNNLPTFKDANEATGHVNGGKITNGSLYINSTLGGLISVAKGSKKLPPKDPIKQV